MEVRQINLIWCNSVIENLTRLIMLAPCHVMGSCKPVKRLNRLNASLRNGLGFIENELKLIDEPPSQIITSSQALSPNKVESRKNSVCVYACT